jgi:uncharacterized protein
MLHSAPVAKWPSGQTNLAEQSMKISGESQLDAPRETIWPLIFDPSSLLNLIPGCDSVEQISPDEYRCRMTLRVPAIAGSYEARVKVLEYEEPSFCRIRGEATGPGGGVQGQANFRLAPEGDQTRIEYLGDALISGPLAGMNPRFAEGVAQTMIRQGLARLPALARERAAASSGLPAGESVTGHGRFRTRLDALISALRRWLGGLKGRLQSRSHA